MHHCIELILNLFDRTVMQGGLTNNERMKKLYELHGIETTSLQKRSRVQEISARIREAKGRKVQ